MDLSRYEFGIAVQFEWFRQAQVRDWVLYLVQKQGIQTRAGFVAREHRVQARKMIEQSLAELFERGWLVGNQQLSVTDAGREHLRRWV